MTVTVHTYTIFSPVVVQSSGDVGVFDDITPFVIVMTKLFLGRQADKVTPVVPATITPSGG
jgi:hypothetical protein